MSEGLIRAAIKSALEGVGGIGTVHDYERWATEWGDFLSLYKTSGNVINGWTITRQRTTEEQATTSHTERTHHFLIRGIYGLRDADATEITFQSLIEAICAAFRALYRIDGTAMDNEPIQVELVENRMFGTVLCHYCELTLAVTEQAQAWS